MKRPCGLPELRLEIPARRLPRTIHAWASTCWAQARRPGRYRTDDRSVADESKRDAEAAQVPHVALEILVSTDTVQCHRLPIQAVAVSLLKPHRQGAQLGLALDEHHGAGKE